MNVKRVVIVGGGSSGWIAATYLDSVLNYGGEKVADITLVESPDIPRISVGEATIPSMRHLLGAMRVNELEFMRACNATIKQSIKYVNWLHGNDHYHHPFSRYREGPIDRRGMKWLRSDRSVPFLETVSAQPGICEMNLAPVMLPRQDLDPPLTYAYHMDAQKFADYLTTLATSRGVKHVQDDMVEVDVKENGHIEAIRTKGGLRLEGDLFVDCTGFSALLIEKKLGVRFVDCSQWLLNDRAVTMHVPYELHYTGYVRPYTTATALSAGWVWEIPMTTQRSIGYVYSGDFISDEDAEREIRAFEGEHSLQINSRLIRFRVGRRERAWAGNCVAIGLSGGFIEPLESTGLYLSDLASVMLAEHFPRGDEMEPLAYRFNRILANRFYEILDFINMHYCLTQRTDTDYWKEVQKPERIVPRLQAKLDYWRVKPPSPTDFEDQFLPGMPDNPLDVAGGSFDTRAPIDTAALWNHESYECIMYGMDFMRQEYAAMASGVLPPTEVPNYVTGRLEEAQIKLPPHNQWLRRVLGMPNFPTTTGPSW